MNEKITVHGNPENSVFGIIGENTLTDENKFYVKVENDTKNNGWREIPPTPSPTPTITVTPTKTPIVTRQPAATPTVTPTHTPTITLTPSPSSTQGLVTPTPTNTPFKTSVQYTIQATGGGTASRIDGPSPTGTISIGTGTMQLQAIVSEGYIFSGWTAPEGVILSNIYSLNPIASGFNVSNNVTITANFSEIPPEGPYRIDAVTDYMGRILFNYIDSGGSVSTFSMSGKPAGILYWGIACGYLILDVTYAETVDLSSDPC
jgi:uncharacterized repeat protein (TIGR02543 family)